MTALCCSTERACPRQGALRVPLYKPWLNGRDSSHIFFASVHGFDSDGGHFYPGTGATADTASRAFAATEAHDWAQDGVVESPGTWQSHPKAAPPVVDVGMCGQGPRSSNRRAEAWRRVWQGASGQAAPILRCRGALPLFLSEAEAAVLVGHGQPRCD